MTGRGKSKRGGRRTSLGGKALEDVVRCIRLVGFVECKASELTKSKQDMFQESQRLLIANMPYTTIFGTKGRREYFIQSDEWTGELECKFQNDGGSVDEKMVYISETLKRTSLTRIAIVYGGEFWTNNKRAKAIIQWMKTEAESICESTGKELLIFDLDGFIKWVQRTWRHGA